MRLKADAVEGVSGVPIDARRDGSQGGGEILPLIELSIVIPCLNEIKTLPAVLRKAHRTIRRLSIRGEVVVADNGSTDGSQDAAKEHGARVVTVARRGYGAALRAGVAAARGEMIVMGDADDTYDFDAIDDFIAAMRDGATFVMGTRLGPGRILPGANPWLNRYVGTPALTLALNRLFGTRVNDVNCGLRGILREQFLRLDLRSDGMEFASEMLIKAAIQSIPIVEVPVTLHHDRRGRPTHLHRWRDGWRHLELMLVHAPDQLLFRPGVTLLTAGLLLAAPLVLGPIHVAGRVVDFHTLFCAAAGALIGLQGVLGALMTRALVPGASLRSSRWADACGQAFTLGRGLLAAAVIAGVGLALEATVVARWARAGFENINEPRCCVLGMLLLAVGAEVGLFSLLHATLKKHIAQAL